jgi:hypothetical protein
MIRSSAAALAAALWVALNDCGSVDAARRSVAGFAAPDVEVAALELLH